MTGRFLFSAQVSHEFVRFPHFGPFLSATEAGVAVDRLIARYDGLSVNIHVFDDDKASDISEKNELCNEQVESACSEFAVFSVVEPIKVLADMPTTADISQLPISSGQFGYLKTDDGYLLLRLHIATPDLQKALTAARWRRKELAGDPREEEVVVMHLSVPIVCQS